ncbi:MAG: FmdB family zinc ribbon protein [Nevskiales bacterium]
MPIYEYFCRACGRETERLQKLSDPPLSDCPECGRPELARKLSAPSFRLKGGGWYETDFKGDKDKKRNLAGDKAETGPTSKPESPSMDKSADKATPKAETKTESKPAARPAESKSTPASGGKTNAA